MAMAKTKAQERLSIKNQFARNKSIVARIEFKRQRKNAKRKNGYKLIKRSA